MTTFRQFRFLLYLLRIGGEDGRRPAYDRATALAFYELGYTVLRYSGDGIRDGSALVHFQAVMSQLNTCQRVYRNWHPQEEQAA